MYFTEGLRAVELQAGQQQEEDLEPELAVPRYLPAI